jgi:hypothetical protein
MQIILYTLIAFALIGAACTFLCVMCGTDLSDLLPVYNPRKKKVGAAFWGAYNGVDPTKAEETFKLPKLPEEDMAYLVGSTKYAMGKPVKSARS